MSSLSIEQAYKDLFDAEYEKLCRLAYSYMKDEQLSEDIVQETFIKIWEQKQDIITSPSVRFYIITSVKNNCISVIRKQKTQKVQYTEEVPDGEIEPFFAVDHATLHNEQQRKIAAALDLLPPKCKEVFMLVKLHDLSYKQAAENLNISVKTIENQMGKALKIFRQLSETPTLVILLLMLLLKQMAIGVF